ncbi:MAG: hypothetical protein LBD74_06685, partial [Spirochaetaceae bacterium]|nr:hypothetical protein [Spirochaetaceae bacterium]
ASRQPPAASRQPPDNYTRGFGFVKYISTHFSLFLPFFTKNFIFVYTTIPPPDRLPPLVDVLGSESRG